MNNTAENTTLHPAEQYIEDVLSGAIPACRQVQLAYKRHKKDLKQCKKKGWVFNPHYAQRVINMFAAMVHYDGAYQGRPFILEPWQQAIIWVVFGWRMGHKDGPRRFRTAYIEIPKKNGKTAMSAGLATFLAFFDGIGTEAVRPITGVQVYSAATKRDQAKICLTDAQKYIRNSPALRNEFDLHTNSISHRKRQSSFQSLSKDSGGADGIKPYAAVIDELHRHKDADMVDLLNSSAASDQMLIFEITTAGTDRQSVCYKHHQYTERVNSGRIKDQHWFGLIFSLDKGDDWKEERNWYKANPNLGTGKDLVEFRRKVEAAINDPSKENSVKRYEFNIWTGSEEKWISSEKWDAAATGWDKIFKQNLGQTEDQILTSEDVVAYGGLDLASIGDFNALTIEFVNAVQGWKHTRTWFICPSEKVDDRVEKQNIDFHVWVKEGYIYQVAGNVVDSEERVEYYLPILQKYKVKQVAYDKWNSVDTVKAFMSAGIECVEQSQAISHLSFPTKDFEKEIISGGLTHPGNPAMAWQMDNVLIFRDANDNIKIHKGKSQDKVDGPVSAVMAHAQYLDDHYTEETNYDDLEVFLIK